MITRDGDQVMICCDDCGTESLTYNNSEFQSLITELKADGWKIHNPDGHWTHNCKGCGEDSRLDRAKRKFGRA